MTLQTHTSDDADDCLNGDNGVVCADKCSTVLFVRDDGSSCVGIFAGCATLLPKRSLFTKLFSKAETEEMVAAARASAPAAEGLKLSSCCCWEANSEDRDVEPPPGDNDDFNGCVGGGGNGGDIANAFIFGAVGGGGLCTRGGTGGDGISGGLSKLDSRDEHNDSPLVSNILLTGRLSSSSNIQRAPSDIESMARVGVTALCWVGADTSDPLRNGRIVLYSMLLLFGFNC